MSSRNAADKRSNSKASTGSKAQPNTAQSQRSPFLRGGQRDDLVGIALVLVGVILLIAVIIPGDALLSSAIATGLRFAFGMGAFIVPFAFIIWGVSYFLHSETVNTARLMVGIVLLLLAIMGLLSLLNAGVSEQDPLTLLSESVVVNGGGYVGSGMSWALMTLFGRVISTVVFVALAICGLVLAGISISTPFLFVKNFILQPKDAEYDDFQPEVNLEGIQQRFSDVDEYDYMPEGDETLAFGGATEKRKNRRSKTTSSESEDDTILLSDPHTGGSASEEATVLLDNQPKRGKGSTASKPAKGKGTQGKTSASATVLAPSALEGFSLPPMGLLSKGGKRTGMHTSELKETALHLQNTLEEFSLPARVVGWLAGPTVTMFKVELPSGVRLAKLVSLADDIALSLAAESVRIAQIPQTSLVGVEIPNKTRATVLLGDIIEQCKPGPLQVAVGEDVDGQKICVDLAKMPHLLIAGTTGSGKSVCLNGMIMTMLMRATPAEVRMILIDPKRVEMSLYNDIPHLYVPPVTEPKEAASALRWAVAEMERRLKIFEGVSARNIGTYNKLIQDGKLDDEDGNRPNELPFLVIVIDELSDLMMVAGKDVEDSIVRISQLARAAGIHLIVATQRPSSNVVTGMIKANITNRVALNVATAVDSRVIIDQSGAEKLVGNGDMLFVKPEWGKPKRIQGCFVSDAEILSVVEHLKAQGSPDYHNEILQLSVGGSGASGAASSSGGTSGDEDPLLWDAADAVVNAGLGSTSMLQRRLKVGYARAGRIMDMLEEKGIVGPPDGSRAREVLIDSVEDLEAVKAFEAQDKEDA